MNLFRRKKDEIPPPGIPDLDLTKPIPPGLQFVPIVDQMDKRRVRALERIADALETLAAIAQSEHEASDTGDTAPLTDLAGRPVR